MRILAQPHPQGKRLYRLGEEVVHIYVSHLAYIQNLLLFRTGSSLLSSSCNSGPLQLIVPWRRKFAAMERRLPPPASFQTPLLGSRTLKSATVAASATASRLPTRRTSISLVGEIMFPGLARIIKTLTYLSSCRSSSRIGRRDYDSWTSDFRPSSAG